LKLTRSKVHAWGLTAVKPIEAGQFVIEYTGELIRLSVNSVREKRDSDSDYRFRVDDQWVVDATTKVRSPTSLLVLESRMESTNSDYSFSMDDQWVEAAFNQSMSGS